MNKQFKPMALALACASILVGCDGKSPAGAGVSSSDETKSEISRNLDRLKELSAQRQKGLTEQTPLLPLLFKAVESTVTPLDMSEVGYVGAECKIANDEANRAAVLEELKTAVGPLETIPPTGTPGSLLVHGTRQQLAASCLGRLVALADNPVVGWYGHFVDERNQKQARTLLASATATEIVASSIIPDVANRVGLTRDELIEAMRTLYLERAIDIRAAAMPELDRVNNLPPGTLSLDFSSSQPAPVHFVVPAEGIDVTADAAGVAMTKHGIPQIGKGYVAGTLYTVETVRSTAATTKTAQKIGSGTSATNNQSTKAEAKTQ